MVNKMKKNIKQTIRTSPLKQYNMCLCIQKKKGKLLQFAHEAKKSNSICNFRLSDCSLGE